MPSYTPIMPSGQANGRLIELGTGSTMLHDSVGGAVHIDEVFIYVCNTSTSDVLVTLEIEGTGTASRIIDTIPAQSGFVLMIPGIRVNNVTDIDGKAGTVNTCNALVIVNRITLTEGL